jgi:hypothetical protein
MQYADISQRTLRSWIHSPMDPPPAVRVAGKILVRRKNIDAWLEKHRVKPLETVGLDTVVEDMLRGVHLGR